MSQYTIFDNLLELISLMDYSGLDDTVFEPDYSVGDFINTNLPLRGVGSWTNNMLTDKMDEPFYRLSMFDNYLIKGEDGHD